MSNKKINYLLNQFNVIELEEIIDGAKSPKIFSLLDKGLKHKDCENFLLEKDEVYLIRRPLFDYLLSFDPTKKLFYSTWLLNLLKKELKTKDKNKIIRFLFEDLDNISNNLKLFENLKKKKIFKEVCKNNLSLHDVKDFLDINNYKSSETLFDAIYPFLERNESGLLSELRFFVNLKEAQILFEDRRFIVYTPLTLRASSVFGPFANWCTARPKNTMFKHYTSKASSINKNSKLFVIIRKSDLDMYQIHFETEQIHNKSNSSATKRFSKDYLNNSQGLDKFFYDTLLKLINGAKNPHHVKTYTQSALCLGYSNILLNYYNTKLEKIRFEKNYFSSKLELNKFTRLHQLVLNECELTEIFDGILEIKTLKILSLPNNLITEIPEDIIKLKNLYVLNLNNNKIKKFSSSISKLDPNNGGSLVRLTIKNNNLTDSQIDELKKMLPNVSVE